MYGGRHVPERELELRRALNDANSRAERRHARLALNGARPHASRWSPPPGGRYDDVLIKPATVKSPWVRSMPPNRTSKLSHVPRWALIAWRSGRPLMMLVQFACGSSTFHAVGEDKPSGGECPGCLLGAGRATICPTEPTMTPEWLADVAAGWR